jgi:hypothetical protein
MNRPISQGDPPRIEAEGRDAFHRSPCFQGTAGRGGARRSYSRKGPLWCLVGFLSAVVAVHFAVKWQLPLPQCGLKTLTGVPCPFCGSTRSLFAWSEFDLRHALFLNPLAFLLALAGIAGFFIWSFDCCFGTRCLEAIGRLCSRWPLTRLAVSAVLLNWLYVLVLLPK